MNPDFSQYLRDARAAGCPANQAENFVRAGLVLQPRQLAASAAARLCDAPGGPTAVGYGGARGGGKSYWLLAQMGADDCQRCAGLKCLLLRKSGKSNQENFDDLRRRLFQELEHTYSVTSGLAFKNGSRILTRHYQTENEIDSLLGLEYDVIGIEEATTLTERKLEDLATCARTSKPDWRPRIYSTTNPGGVGHQWYYRTFIIPHQRGTESATRFIPARVDDNRFLNPEYKAILATRTGWQKDAWYHGKWEIAAGQFFRNFHPGVHIIGTGRDEPAGLNPQSAIGNPQFLEELTQLRRFRESEAVEWFAAMDYGYTHLTVVLLGCFDHQDNMYVLDEHAARFGIPQEHARAIKAMFARHFIYAGREHLRETLLAQFPDGCCSERERLWHARQKRMLARFVAGTDIFGSESNGHSVAKQYGDLGLSLRSAAMDRVSGWSAVLQRLGDPAAGIKPTLFIHQRCQHLLACLPQLQHDPDRPGDVLKTNINDEGEGGDDTADCLRYLVATRPNRVYQVKLRGL